MTKVYTTQELIQILAAERQACLKGKRLDLSAIVDDGFPLIESFFNTDGIQKYSAYQGFKAVIHQYQLENQVSGIVWHQITIKGKTLRYPQVDYQLMALPSDLEIIKAARNDVVNFWQEVTADMDLYLSINHGKNYQQIDASEIAGIVQRTEWATLMKWEKSDFLEILLQLGWGKPEEAFHWRGWPHSGSEDIHAVKPGNQPIC
ncbi:MAG: hypothetical protein SAL07_12105 [Oscillatoria sp. PMC 1051.18]|nr:hypothetical protein [Oscillatoria sp. PMC 1050.18]MEC5030631.1 hypothetical protein [Oscillatoria sp. PMC 1051.18]